MSARLTDLVTLGWLSRLRLGISYRQVCWIGMTVLVPVAALCAISIEALDQEAARQGQTIMVDALDVRKNILMVAAAGLLFAMAMGWMNALYLGRPIRAITRAAAAIAEGDIKRKVKLDEQRGDELGELARTFRVMAGYVDEMANAAGRIAAGDLTARVIPRSNDDVLGVAFAEMLSNLHRTVEGITSSAGALADASVHLTAASDQAGSATQQIAVTIQEVACGNQAQTGAARETTASVQQLTAAIERIAKGSQDQAHSVEETSAAVADLGETIARVAVAAKEVLQRAAEAEAAASLGGEAVARNIRAMSGIQSSTLSAASEVRDLTQYSDQIGSIVEAIDDIAEQTNLLALNAAIEAARAGEHGRGFAVVADEVGKLAERAGKSTKEITSLISELRREISEAVVAMERDTAEVDAGVKLTQETGSALDRILVSSRVAGQQAGQIVNAVARMEDASGRVVQLMGSISAVVEESMASTREMSVSSHLVSGAIEKVATVSRETSASAEAACASTEEMSAQVEEVMALAHSLDQMSRGLRAAAGLFKTSDAGWDEPTLGKAGKGGMKSASLEASWHTGIPAMAKHQTERDGCPDSGD
jgi:methyl-accepting chemotaxis protein